MRIDIAADKVEEGYLKPIDDQTRPGSGPSAHDLVAVCYGPSGNAYVCLSGRRYVRYDTKTDRPDPGYPKPLDDTSWPGLGPYAAQVSSVMRWKDGKLQFFLHDERHVRYDIVADRVVPADAKC